MEQRRPDPAAAQQIVEGPQVTRFSFRHAADFGGGTAVAQDRALAVINPGGAEFAGMVDAQHPRDLVSRARVAWQAMARRAGRRPPGVAHRAALRRVRTNTTVQIAAITTEPSKFHPASEIPNNVQLGSSQRTGC